MLNFSAQILYEVFPIFCKLDLLSIILLIDLYKLEASLIFVKYPFSPSINVSLHPGVSVVIIGLPIAVASINVRGIPSR